MARDVVQMWSYIELKSTAKIIDKEKTNEISVDTITVSSSTLRRSGFEMSSSMQTALAWTMSWEGKGMRQVRLFPYNFLRRGSTSLLYAMFLPSSWKKEVTPVSDCNGGSETREGVDRLQHVREGCCFSTQCALARLGAQTTRTTLRYFDYQSGEGFSSRSDQRNFLHLCL